jgi:hypothetical protein
MDITNNNERSDLRLTKARPVVLIVILVILLGGGAYFYFTKNPPTVPSLGTPVSPVYQSPIDIDFEFLKSPAFNSLESFPEYSQFKESDGLGIKTGRDNPFIPPSGVSQSTANQTLPATPTK